jgi:replication factor C small subunit
MKKWITAIARKENLELVEEGEDALYQASGGDLRKATNLLQAASASENVINDVTIYKVLGHIRPDIVINMLQLALKGTFLESRELLRELLIDRGLAPEDIIRIIYREIMRNPSLTEEMKVNLSDKLGEVDYRLTQGARPEIQLSTLLAYLTIVGKEIR